MKEAINRKIARLEEQSRRAWNLWKETSHRYYLYHYKQRNIKIRKLKQASKGASL